MNEIVAIPQPVVFAQDGGVFANSRDVAAFFKKNHKDVLRDIRNLVAKEPVLGQRNFAPFKTNDLTGETTSRYEMDRDGFMLLAMGFTGAKALEWKLLYIEAFNRMEAELRARPVAAFDPATVLEDPAAMRGILLIYVDKVIAANAKIAEQTEQLAEQTELLSEQTDLIVEMTPKAVALDLIATADGSLNITTAAKLLQVRPKDLIGYLQRNRWIYKRAGGRAWLGYQTKTAAGLLEHKVVTVSRPDGTEKIVEQVLITAKGLTQLATLVTSGAGTGQTLQ